MYWGKIIGTLAGLATTKPLFGLLGLLLGHQFDRGYRARFRRGRSDDDAVTLLGETYVRVLFQAIGHVAKADGRVSEDEIRAARSLMHRLGLGPAEVQKAIRWFNAGKEADFPLQRAIRDLAAGEARAADARRLFVRLVLEVSLSKKRLSGSEREMIWRLCRELGVGRVELAQLEAMIRAQKGFRRSPAGDADAARVRDAYLTLGVAKTASNSEIKTAYRRLMNRNHPDKLAGSDPDADVVAEAERRTREVRSAYELLKARRTIR
ncbi:MAG: co-chaperone DjlA [Woeseiaceae bacterium]|nr:co-chaperone DjlA [Woeseiaceae bacterium]